MKKFLAMLCMLTCIFGLTACGSEEEYSSAEQDRAKTAMTITTEMAIPCLSTFADDERADYYLDEYNKDEMAHIAESLFYTYLNSEYGQNLNISRVYVNGAAFLSGITSFNSAFDSIGELQEIGEATAEITDDEITVRVPVTGTLKTAEAEFIYSNDIFLTMQAAALNPQSSMGEKMGKAALNTLMGMGTVFSVLILISLIISAFGLIPKLQAKLAKKADKAEKNDVKTEAVDNTIAQIIEKEEMSDDLELVAVIAAAIAASEGAASADGFVVRSIRKVRR